MIKLTKDQIKEIAENGTIDEHIQADDITIPFQTIDWKNIPKTSHAGETGIAYWQTVQFPGLRIRIVEYSAGYVADHWCQKGHIVYCLEGEFNSELDNGDTFNLKQGMTYVVSDDMGSHKSSTKDGVKLMIVDGDFMKYRK